MPQHSWANRTVSVALLNCRTLARTAAMSTSQALRLAIRILVRLVLIPLYVFTRTLSAIIRRIFILPVRQVTRFQFSRRKLGYFTVFSMLSMAGLAHHNHLHQHRLLHRISKYSPTFSTIRDTTPSSRAQQHQQRRIFFASIESWSVQFARGGPGTGRREWLVDTAVGNSPCSTSAMGASTSWTSRWLFWQYNHDGTACVASGSDWKRHKRSRRSSPTSWWQGFKESFKRIKKEHWRFRQIKHGGWFAVTGRGRAGRHRGRRSSSNGERWVSVAGTVAIGALVIFAIAGRMIRKRGIAGGAKATNRRRDESGDVDDYVNDDSSDDAGNMLSDSDNNISENDEIGNETSTNTNNSSGNLMSDDGGCFSSSQQTLIESTELIVDSNNSTNGKLENDNSGRSDMEMEDDEVNIVEVEGFQVIMMPLLPVATSAGTGTLDSVCGNGSTSSVVYSDVNIEPGAGADRVSSRGTGEGNYSNIVDNGTGRYNEPFGLSSEEEDEVDEDGDTNGSSLSFNCPLCLERCLLNDVALLTRECDHQVCRPCGRALVLEAINQRTCADLRCPVCVAECALFRVNSQGKKKEGDDNRDDDGNSSDSEATTRRRHAVVNQQQALALLTHDQQQAFLAASLALAVDRDRLLVPCLTPDCPGVAVLDSDNNNNNYNNDIGWDGDAVVQTRVRCGACNRAWCATCKSSGLTCSCFLGGAYEDGGDGASGNGSIADNMVDAEVASEVDDDDGSRLLSQVAVAMGWKQCPSCEHMVEREGGCNRMRCRCGQVFCYVCAAQLDEHDSYQHFSENSNNTSDNNEAKQVCEFVTLVSDAQ